MGEKEALRAVMADCQGGELECLMGEKEGFFFNAAREVAPGQLGAQVLQFVPGLVKLEDEGGGVVRKAMMTSVST